MGNNNRVATRNNFFGGGILFNMAILKRYVMFLWLFLPVLAFGQSDTGKIDDFSPGLITAVPSMKVPFGGATVCQNLDLSEGVLKVRPGYDSVFGFKGMDSIIGLGALYKHDGTQYLFAVADSLGVGYGGIYASTEGTHEFGSTTDSFYIVPDTTGYGSCSGKTPLITYYGLSVSVAGRLSTTVYSDSVYCDTAYTCDPSEPATSANCALNRICSVMVARLDASDVSKYFTMSNHDTAFSMKEKASYNSTISYETSMPPCYYYCLGDFVITDSVLSSENAPNRIWPYFSVQSKPRFAQFNDQIYVVNGDQRGVVIDDAHNGFIAQSYPLPAPGEPLIVPLKDTGKSSTYTLDGEYRYAFRHSELHDDSTIYDAYAFSTISAPVKVKDGRFMLRKFQETPKDSVRAKSKLGAGDTITVEVWRSRSNPGRITTSTYLFDTKLRLLIMSDTTMTTDTADGHTAEGGFATLSATYLIDSIPDSQFEDSLKALEIDSMWGWFGRDSTGVLLRRYGAPAYISSTIFTTTNDSGVYVDDSNGVFIGWPTQNDTLGVVYYCVWHDTITGNQGNIGEGCVVWTGEGERNFKNITIGLPKIPAGDSGIVMDIYRGMIYQIGYDTGNHYRYYDDTVIMRSLGFPKSNLLKMTDNKLWPKAVIPRKEWIDQIYLVDSTIVFNVRFLVQLPSSDTVYTDSIRQDSLETKKLYGGISTPSVLANVLPYDNYMFGYKGSQLWRSNLDSAWKWGVWNITEVDRDNGDQITLVVPGRTAMKIYKFFSKYNIYDGYTKPEIVGRWGCIAPFSYVPGVMDYYLSASGIIGESEGQYLERTFNQGLISKQLNNFNDLSLATKYGMVGQYLPTEQTALFCLGDTTYAYFERTGSWATWDLSFGGGCLYDVENELEFLPGKTFYFFKPGDSTIFTFGTSNTDNGDSIRVEWKSGAIYSDRFKERVQDIGLWVESTNGEDSLVLVYVLNDGGDTLSTTAFSDLNDARYHLKEVATAEPGQYFQIYIVSAKSLADTRINGIDFRYMRAEEKQAK